MAEDNVGEGQQKVDDPQVDKEGKHPETVSWNQYVGIKESLGGKLTKETQKVTDLEERIKKTVSAEEHQKVTEELTGAKTSLEEKTTELNAKVEATLSEKREVLVKRGVSEDKVKNLSEKEIDAVLTVEVPKPKADLAGGSGADTPSSSKAKMSSGWESLHPQN